MFLINVFSKKNERPKFSIFKFIDELVDFQFLYKKERFVVPSAGACGGANMLIFICDTEKMIRAEAKNKGNSAQDTAVGQCLSATARAVTAVSIRPGSLRTDALHGPHQVAHYETHLPANVWS